MKAFNLINYKFFCCSNWMLKIMLLSNSFFYLNVMFDRRVNIGKRSKSWNTLLKESLKAFYVIMKLRRGLTFLIAQFSDQFTFLFMFASKNIIIQFTSRKRLIILRRTFEWESCWVVYRHSTMEISLDLQVLLSSMSCNTLLPT